MKLKIIILSFICALLVTGCNNKDTSLDKDAIEANTIEEISNLVSKEKFSEAGAVLDFAKKQIDISMENISGTIESLILAKDYYNKKEYDTALIHATEAYDFASGEQMVRAISDFKEKISKAKNSVDYNDSNEENLEDITSIPEDSVSIPLEWNNIACSSYLHHKTKNYKPESAIDGKSDTAWIENGKNEDGIGDYIELRNNNTVRIDKICMTNGFASDEKTYIRNNRIENIRIVFYDEQGEEVSNITHTFDDNNLNIVPIEIIGGIQANSIRIYIESVYNEGRIDKDTCISDLAIYGEILN